MTVNPELMQYGGFAFAALIFAGMLIFFGRIGASFLEKREQFIDRLLASQSTDHVAMTAAITTNAEATKQLAGTVMQFGLALTEGLKELTQEVRADRMDRARQHGGM